jgi:hypothetical protein
VRIYEGAGAGFVSVLLPSKKKITSMTGRRVAAGESPRALRGIMSSQPSNFRRNDVKRAVQALHGAGLKVGRVELHGGNVPIIPAGDEEVADDSNNGFDKITLKPGVV